MTTVPPNLEVALAAAAGVPGINVTGAWQNQGGNWYIEVEATLSSGPSQHLPAKSNWVFVAEGDYPAGTLDAYPARNGITVTFRHQLANREPRRGEPWRRGKVCLGEVGHLLGRGQQATQPTDASGRLRWHFERLNQWLAAAASAELADPGTPFELPDFDADANLQFGFHSEPDDAAYWAKHAGKWGLLELRTAAGKHRWLAEFKSANGAKIGGVAWSPDIEQGGAELGAWAMLPQAPVVSPWAAPYTWRELDEILDASGVMLADLLAGLPPEVVGRPWILALGFPIPEKIGDPPTHAYWQALQVPASPEAKVTQGRSHRFQATRYTAWLRARTQPLHWLTSTNWSPDQVHRRGGVSEWLRDRRVLLLGCGSLGSAVADMLVRGGVSRLSLMDPEKLEAWNIVRHQLTLRHLGRNKAKSLADELVQRNPRARIKAYGETFPGALDALEIREHSVVVDCTGSSSALHALNNFSWGFDQTFISLSIDSHAQRIFGYIHQGRGFPIEDFEDQFQSAFKDAPGPEAGPTGCWSPVFPGPWHRIVALAGMAVDEALNIGPHVQNHSFLLRTGIP